MLLGLYGFYLMWTGLPVLKRVPNARVLPYAVSVAAWALVLELAVTVALAATFGVPR